MNFFFKLKIDTLRVIFYYNSIIQIYSFISHPVIYIYISNQDFEHRFKNNIFDDILSIVIQKNNKQDDRNNKINFA